MSPNETDETKSPAFRCKIESPSGLVQSCQLTRAQNARNRGKSTKIDVAYFAGLLCPWCKIHDIYSVKRSNGNVDYFFFDFFAGFLQQQAVNSPWVCVIAA